MHSMMRRGSRGGPSCLPPIPLPQPPLSLTHHQQHHPLRLLPHLLFLLFLFSLTSCISGVAAQAKAERRYPMLDSIPDTSFRCRDHNVGYYADQETGCQVYHMCDTLGKQYSYLCPNHTLFHQKFMVCDHWYMVDCPTASQYYHLNNHIGQVGEGDDDKKEGRDSNSKQEVKGSKISSPVSSLKPSLLKPSDPSIKSPLSPFTTPSLKSPSPPTTTPLKSPLSPSTPPLKSPFFSFTTPLKSPSPPTTPSLKFPFSTSAPSLRSPSPPTTPSLRSPSPPTTPSLRSPFSPSTPSLRSPFSPSTPSLRSPFSPSTPSLRSSSPPFTSSLKPSITPSSPSFKPSSLSPSLPPKSSPSPPKTSFLQPSLPSSFTTKPSASLFTLQPPRSPLSSHLDKPPASSSTKPQSPFLKPVVSLSKPVTTPIIVPVSSSPRPALPLSISLRPFTFSPPTSPAPSNLTSSSGRPPFSSPSPFISRPSSSTQRPFTRFPSPSLRPFAPLSPAPIPQTFSFPPSSLVPPARSQPTATPAATPAATPSLPQTPPRQTPSRLLTPPNLEGPTSERVQSLDKGDNQSFANNVNTSGGDSTADVNQNNHTLTNDSIGTDRTNSTHNVTNGEKLNTDLPSPTEPDTQDNSVGVATTPLPHFTMMPASVARRPENPFVFTSNRVSKPVFSPEDLQQIVFRPLLIRPFIKVPRTILTGDPEEVSEQQHLHDDVTADSDNATTVQPPVLDIADASRGSKPVKFSSSVTPANTSLPSSTPSPSDNSTATDPSSSRFVSNQTISTDLLPPVHPFSTLTISTFLSPPRHTFSPIESVKQEFLTPLSVPPRNRNSHFLVPVTGNMNFKFTSRGNRQFFIPPVAPVQQPASNTNTRGTTRFRSTLGFPSPRATGVISEEISHNDINELGLPRHNNTTNHDHDHGHSGMTMVFPAPPETRMEELKLNPNCPRCHPAFLRPGECHPCVVIK